MTTPQLSPGVITREVDLTVGRADNVLDNIGAIAGPFQIGPVNQPITVSTEQQLINYFGKPLSKDGQYEYWMSASTYLTYGGTLKVVRVDGDNLTNAGIGTTSSATPVKIRNFDHYNLEFFEDNNPSFVFAAKTPGTWGNSLKVCIIDNKADQTITISQSKLGTLPQNYATSFIGYGVTATLNQVSIPGVTNSFTGYVKGIITGISTETVDGNALFDVKILSRVSSDGTETEIEYSNNNAYSSFSPLPDSNTSLYIINEDGDIVSPQNGVGNVSLVGTGTTILSEANEVYTQVSGISTNGTGARFTITRNNVGQIDSVLITSEGTGYVQNASITISGTSIGGASPADNVTLLINGVNATISVGAENIVDWYDQQTLGLNNNIYWKSIAPKPKTNNYALNRNSKNDVLHVVVVGDRDVILEKHLNLSKAIDSVSEVNYPQKNWYKSFIANYSNNIYCGLNISAQEDLLNKVRPVATAFKNGFVPYTINEGFWDQPAQDNVFSAVGAVTYKLSSGADYDANGGMVATLGSLLQGYNLFLNKNNIAIDYLIYGPSLPNLYESQEKAYTLISIAEYRKDCLAVISPYRQGVVDQTNTTTQTNNIIKFFGALPSTSYAIFDSGYKYTYDRFNNLFRYIPCNADIAGLMMRTNVESYPWFSPAGQQRGVLNNAIKLAYNPDKDERDLLYTARVNAIHAQPGIGTVLWGDKTALGYASAFDRINVRRLFLTIEQALERTAQAQLFEFNDAITRANFVNIVEPYLRDIQAKRGLIDFRVICDESNNTPDIIDNNEFRADIFIKPNKSINYITLTFVATRTGISFEEVTGRV